MMFVAVSKGLMDSVADGYLMEIGASEKVSKDAKFKVIKFFRYWLQILADLLEWIVSSKITENDESSKTLKGWIGVGFVNEILGYIAEGLSAGCWPSYAATRNETNLTEGSVGAPAEA